MRALNVLSWLLLVFAAKPCIAADPYPSKPIRLIAPVSPGMMSDRYARTYAEGLAQALGQPVMVENRPGAGGNIVAAELVAKAKPDGYTLLWGQNALFGTIPHVHKNLSFDVLKDFVPVAPNAKSHMFFCVPAHSPARTLKDFVKLVQSKPGALNYGSVGIGSGPHVAMELLKHEARLDIQHVPYKGGSPEVLRALLAGEIAAALDYYVPMMAQAKSGKIRILAVTSPQRLVVAPDIPTVAEQGITGFEYFGWSGLFAPMGTPPELVQRLNAEFAKIRKGDAMRRLLAEFGSMELPGSQSEFAAFVREDFARGARLVRISGATVE